MEFQVGHLALFYHLLIVGFKYFCMGSLHNNIQLVLVFLEDPFLVLYVPYYTLMTFLMMLYVILLSMLTMQLSTLSVLRHSASFSWIYDCSHLTYDLNGLRSRVNKLRSFSEFFWIRFLSCFSSFLLLCFSSCLLFLVTRCLVVAFQPWIKSIRIKKKEFQGCRNCISSSLACWHLFEVTLEFITPWYLLFEDVECIHQPISLQTSQ